MRWWRRQRPVHSYEMDDLGVRRLRDGEVFEQVRWAELTAVDVLTTSDGPWNEDLFFVLKGRDDTGVVVASGLAPEGFVARLGQLEGFDNRLVVEAAGTTTEARFHCWPTAADR